VELNVAAASALLAPGTGESTLISHASCWILSASQVKLERMARFAAPASAVLASSLSVVALFRCGCSEWMKSTVHRLAYMKKLNVAA